MNSIDELPGTSAKGPLLLLLQGARFVVVGLINTVVAVAAIFISAVYFNFSDLAANATGYLLGLVVGFILNRGWTFRSSSKSWALPLRYAIAFLIAYTINLCVVFSLESIGFGRLYAQGAGVPAYTLSFFFLCRLVVFGKVSDDRS